MSNSHLVVGFVETIGERSSGGLVDDTENVESSNLPSIFGGLK